MLKDSRFEVTPEVIVQWIQIGAIWGPLYIILFHMMFSPGEPMEDKEVDDLISGYEDSQGCVNYEGKLPWLPWLPCSAFIYSA